MKCNQVRSAQWTVQKKKTQQVTQQVTQHKRIYINKGKKYKEEEKIKSKMSNKINCAKQYTEDLINSNINREIHN